MTMDNEQVVPENVVPPEGTTSQEVPKPPEPSPEEKMAALVSQKVAEEIAKITEASKREIQSAKDKATAEVLAAQRRARLAEGTMGAVRTQLQSLDPDTAKEVELAQLRAERAGRQEQEQAETMLREQAEFHQQFHANLTQFITGLGVDPTDKRIDWAGDAPNYLEAQRRVLDSVTKLQKENVKALEMGIDAKIKEAEKRIRKDLGAEDANSVSTQVSGGVSSDGIPTDMSRFRKWVETLSQKEYEEKSAKIDEMMRNGKIK